MAYSPPLGPPLAGNPRVFLGLRAGGVSLGRVVLELRADAAPVAAENFRQLCAFGVYRGSLVHRVRGADAACCFVAVLALAPSSSRRAMRCVQVFDAFCIHGGDYNRRCSVVCPPGDATCFDLSLVPYAPGGRSVYSDRPDGLFDDEASGFTHAAGTLSMSNPGTANSNGSQWFITTTPAGAPPTHLDGRYVVFGQVLEGYDIVAAVSTLGRKDGTPRQRVVVEECGEVGAEGERGDEAGAGARAAAADGRGVAAAAAAVMARGGRAAARGARGGLRRGKWARVAGATLHARCLFA